MSDREIAEELTRIIMLRNEDKRIDALMSFFDTLLLSGRYERFLELGEQLRPLMGALMRGINEELFARRVQETGRLIFTSQRQARASTLWRTASWNKSRRRWRTTAA